MDVRDDLLQVRGRLSHIREAEGIDSLLFPVRIREEDAALPVQEEDSPGEDRVLHGGFQGLPLGIPVVVLEVDLPGEGNIV